MKILVLPGLKTEKCDGDGQGFQNTLVEPADQGGPKPASKYTQFAWSLFYVVAFLCACVLLMDQVDRALYDGKFMFSSYYGDHMVLQQQPARALVWGYVGSEGWWSPLLTTTSVIVNFNNKDYHAHVFVRVDGVKVWSVSLDPTPPGGPHTLTAYLSASVRSRLNPLTLTDVMVGDVWICSGQSNMQFRVAQVFNASHEFTDSLHYPHIRVFAVTRQPSDLPLLDLKGIDQPWARASPNSLGINNPHIFSGVCYLFAKYTYSHLRHPIGLIESDWGGTPIRVWTPREVNTRCGEPTHTSPPISDESLSTSGLGPNPIPSQASVLWNSMIHPLLNMTIFGALWYQDFPSLSLDYLSHGR